MDDSVFSDRVFFEKVNITDSPWSVDNLLFEEVLTSGLDDDITDLFNGEEKDDEGIDEDTISEPGSPRRIEALSDEEIKNLRVQELNQLLRGLPQDEAAKIRRRRRNLKNRGYALTCRQRRLQLQEELLNENNFLKRQLEDNREKLDYVTKERNVYKRKFLQLQSAFRGELMLEQLVPPYSSWNSVQLSC